MYSDVRYTALFLKEVDSPALLGNPPWAPLALACFISESSPLILPLRSSISRIIDSAFDEILRYLELGKFKTLKDFVANSKGILYAKDLAMKERVSVLERASLILTTDEKVEELALVKNLPHVFISSHEETELSIRARYLEGEYYEQLRHNLQKYVGISLQVGYLAKSGPTTFGHPMCNRGAETRRKRGKEIARETSLIFPLCV